MRVSICVCVCGCGCACLFLAYVKVVSRMGGRVRVCVCVCGCLCVFEYGHGFCVYAFVCNVTHLTPTRLHTLGPGSGVCPRVSMRDNVHVARKVGVFVCVCVCVCVFVCMCALSCKRPTASDSLCVGVNWFALVTSCFARVSALP